MALSGYQRFNQVDASKLDEVARTFSGFLFEGPLAPRWTEGLGLYSNLPTRGNEAKVKLAHRVGTGVHEWKTGDERVYQGIKHKDTTIEVKRHANAIEFDMDELDDEGANLNQYKDLISGMPQDFADEQHRRVLDLLVTAESDLAYDGVAFFSASHPVEDNGDGVTTASNLITSAFSETALYEAMFTMTKMRMPDGQLAYVQPDYGIFPETLRATVEKVLGSDTAPDGSDGAMKSNPMKGRIKPIFDSRLDIDSTVDWYLWDSRQRLKPFFLADRAPVTAQMAVDEWNRKVRWGSWRRYNCGLGFYQAILKAAV